MSIFVTVSLFIIGFVLLIKGADVLVEGSSAIAKKFGISNIVIGLTIVAFGTSFPELIISSFAAYKGSAGVALGNIIGSNISNTLLILGVAAIIRPLIVKKNTVSKEIPLSLLAIFAVGFMVNDRLIDGMNDNLLTRIDGLVLMLFFAIFIYYTFGISRVKVGVVEKLREEKLKEHSILASISMILIGLVGLYFGGQWIVSGAIAFATMFGISEVLIGLTVVAIGTSLPELAASAVAAYKGKTDMAVGAVVGSNIFNLLWVLGMSSVIRPIPFDDTLNVDIFILIVITIILLPLIFIGKKNILGKIEGALLLTLYFIYIIFLIVRG